jgi:diguanylate cyclase (GGDEF)-like protein/PAS domain S-box-containing protein
MMWGDRSSAAGSGGQQLHRVLANSRVALLMFDAAGVMTLCEGGDSEALGLPTPALAGMTLAGLAAQAPEAAAAIERSLAGDTCALTLAIRGHHYDFRCRPEIDPDGSIVGASAVASDVTDSIEALAEARKREVRWESLVSQSADVAVIGDASTGAIGYVSPAATRLFGWQPADLYGRSALSLVHPDDAERVSEALIAAGLNADAHIAVEFRFACADGSYRWVEETIRNLASTPEIEGFVGNIRDISERVAAAARLERREGRWQALVSESADVALVADPITTCITYASPAITRLFGWQPAELLGRPGIELVHPGDLDRVTRALSIIAEPSDRHVTIDFRLRCSDGAYRWVEETIRNLANVAGIDGLVGNIRDITERRTSEETLRQRDRLTRALASKASDIALVVGVDGCVRYLNPSASSVLVAAEGDTLDFGGLDYVHPDDREMVGKTLGSVTAPDSTARMTYRRIGVDGRWRWVEQIITNCVDNPDIRGLVVNLREITQQVEAQRALMASEERYRLIAETAQEGIWATDRDGQTLYANQKMAELLGHPLHDLYAKPVWELITGSTRSGFFKRLERRQEQGADRYDLRHTRPDGSRRVLGVSVSPFLDNGNSLGSLAMVSDLTDARSAESSLRHRASHDPLTGLANRSLLAERLQEALDACTENGSGSVAVLAADIDHFKLVNDSFGHACGDELLIEVSRRWQARLRRGELFARFGGDEFVILCRDTGEEPALQVAARLLKTLHAPIQLDGRTVAANASIGIAVAVAGDIGDAETLMRYADAAMYEAKACGRGRSEVFSPHLIERAQKQLELFNDLKLAIANDELTVHYQPVVEIATGKLLGVEALCRWSHPRRGAVTPDEFIKAAEESGLIVSLDRWVLGQACKDGAALRRSGVLSPDAYVSVNASAVSLAQPDYEKCIRSALQRTGLPAAALHLEVTESAVMTDPDAAQRVLESLHALGIAIAIDDFGTGYSSLAYLRRFPVATLKIDRSFITHMSETADDHAIVQAVVDLAKALNIDTIAEGVETTTDLDLLEQLGCTAGQGFLWSSARPPAELATLVNGLQGGRFDVNHPPTPVDPSALPPPRRSLAPHALG